MANEKELNVGSGWAHAPSMSSNHNQAEYDELAPRYEQVVAEWRYDAPPIAARMLVRHLDGTAGPVLDCACGTGMTGEALHALGFTELTGVDISTTSLERARAKGVYRELVRADLQALPLAELEARRFDAVQCVAAMAFIDAEPMFREMCRLVRPGGVALYTQRVDLYEARGYAEIERKLEAEGLWSALEASEPRPYLPGHPEYGSRILVRYHAFRVS
jgi:predicted TPR repeat methyltransferase